MQRVILAHNHSFVSPDKTHMLRSQRRMTKADEHIISKMRQAGVRPTEIYDFFQRWSGGAENVQFLKMDCNNFIGRERKRYLEAQDAQTLLEYLENKQVQDPSFYYAVQLDKEDGRICNFFWADGQAIQTMLTLGMSCALTLHFRQINLKCLLLLFLEQIIIGKPSFLELHYYSMKVLIHLYGFLEIF